MNINLGNKYNTLLSNWDAENITLGKLLWKDKTLIYFYPKDNTPWCTLENKDFSCLEEDFTKKWVKLIWVSKDTVESHKKFVEKQNLNIDLISDPELSLHKELLAYWEKNNYWKLVMWVIRSTFLINNKWKILNEWRNIRAKWHANRIFNEL